MTPPRGVCKYVSNSCAPSRLGGIPRRRGLPPRRLRRQDQRLRLPGVVRQGLVPLQHPLQGLVGYVLAKRGPFGASPLEEVEGDLALLELVDVPDLELVPVLPGQLHVRPHLPQAGVRVVHDHGRDAQLHRHRAAPLVALVVRPQVPEIEPVRLAAGLLVDGREEVVGRQDVAPRQRHDAVDVAADAARRQVPLQDGPRQGGLPGPRRAPHHVEHALVGVRARRCGVLS
mmetsp:Transcript_22822/g.63829  ORF Transcript_22822/g.63829 Transcript_22822/m.63829 type:complete len:229 (+) Transcript_22822:82-768(+)